jgi:hypothetical protein
MKFLSLISYSYIMLQQSVPHTAAFQPSIAGHCLPHATNAVQAFSLPLDVAPRMADDGSQRLAMAVARSECQSRFDSLILNHGVAFFPSAGQVNSPKFFQISFSTFLGALEQVLPAPRRKRSGTGKCTANRSLRNHTATILPKNSAKSNVDMGQRCKHIIKGACQILGLKAARGCYNCG